MQKKRPRGDSGIGERTERTVRVRSRLVAGVAVVGVTVLAAGTPAILSASSELSESQRLVTLAELNRQAVTLAHSLADERDDVTAFIAAGRGGGEEAGAGADDGDSGKDTGLSASRSARVDRQMDEIEPAAPAALRRDLARIPGIRRDALTGKGTALEAHKAYTGAIEKLQDLADELADKTPPRAAEATRAPASLGHATEQAAATRGLLLAALSVPRESTGNRVDPVTGLLVPVPEDPDSESVRARNALTAAAQQSRVRELAALADFDQAAGHTARESLKTTVTGPEVKTAEQFLARLTDQPQLSDAELGTDRAKAEAALSARINLMRGVESSLGSAQVNRLSQLRDDDVTELEIRIALAGACLLFAVGVSTAVARTLTRPLAVLRLGAARLAAEPEPGGEAVEPVRFNGRNDEFAQVVRSLNTLHARLAEVGARAEKLSGDRTHLIGQRETLATQRAELQEQVAETAARLERMRHTVHSTFVNLSLRTLGVVERQLGVIESLEEREQDPERLATLFKLDHMATVMRRHGENLLVLAGTEHGQGQQGPVPLVDVLRAAVSEIERYERVAIQSIPPHAQVAGFAANDLSHLLAELLENATSFSPPDAKVELSGWLLESGEVMLSVQDEGIGVPPDRLTELNARLAEPASHEPGDGTDGGIGLHVAALLAARHGVRVTLREQKQGGVAAVVVLPDALLPSAPPMAAPPAVPVAGDAPTLNLPGSVAEANSNALPGRSALDDPLREGRKDPLVEAAERTIREDVEQSEQDARPEAEAEVEPEVEPAADDAPEAQAERAEAADGGTEATGATSATGASAAGEATEVTRPAVPAAATPTVPDPYAIGPDAHERAADGNADTGAPVDEPTWTMRLPQQSTAPAGEMDADSEVAARSADDTDAAAEAGTAASVTPATTRIEPVTDKGLPKRTPKVVKSGPAEPAERSGSVDADALRRRLGGFHQGAIKGRRDVEAEISASEDRTDTEEVTDPETETKGDTVEEARS
ncbi:histidine kinase [Streptomyces agglomeratus]|uniref:histidine kinase n=1 Tax=Streptomyces agglomeratus TaxID=285458 RepID=A0A1E5P692_9ACTN|nr:nitrate- and nitrite sensing domain-containing protein [Streptomyces agglomeratus]OEJ25042.1 histidine kinase [Streptomyces agglomeratus]OEJ40933.1 histidine kinase [Streptomyces agglomeratus]OEJ48888.1 histidine kinase [Streptomyces agglomeratus]OEJ53469.1 histidine kinase [Streptomyces agglomeratus]